MAVLCLISVSTITSSCSKDLKPTPMEVDSLKSVLPKQIIYEVPGTGQGAHTNVVSIKYDTINHLIQLYEDDTTNANPYDKLLASYSFNNDGYLVTFEIRANNLADLYFTNEIVEIHRLSNNNISYIVYNDRDYNQTDTTFYKYQTVAGRTDISTDGIGGYFENNTIYHYDNNFRLMAYENDYASGNFSYNLNNSISKIVGKGIGDNVAEFSYASGISDEKEDLTGRLFTGKDYYLWDLKELNPFVFNLDADYDNFSISATNPYHITTMKDTHQPDASPTGIEEGTFTYELNENKLLSKVTYKIDGKLEGIVMFKY